MKRLEIKAPAKINFGLTVNEKRSDGYHNIQTIFYPINLCDKLIFSPSESFSFFTDSTELQNSKDNSIIKAVNLLEEKIKEKINIKIKLIKKIPMGAGMGGGSSDGATTLIALNEFLNLNLPSKTLTKLALKIGSDAPFFLSPSPSFASNRGEKLTQIDFQIPYPILIVYPSIHISTKWAFENIKPKKRNIDYLNLLNRKKLDLYKIKTMIVNDFENSVFLHYPVIKKIKEQLYKTGALFSLMTGSGSSVFGIFENLKAANMARNSFQNNYFTYIHKPSNYY
jgi:4-diphosphocytidyl-2-C-methyl-D-erythritol kinase